MELHAARAVYKVNEGGLAVPAAGGNPACQPVLRVGFLASW
jgi:hypothetical protein